ncbi:inositol monophosphatase 1-like [Glandiceps talaboti]
MADADGNQVKKPRSENEAKYDDHFEVVVRIAREAGEVIREAYKLEKRVLTKSSAADLVTETDQRVEKMIISKLKEKFPTHSFIGEESVAAGGHCNLTDNPTWIIDPIDGTTNFVHRFPYVAVCIALVVNKITEIGVVYNAIHDEMFTARREQGAFCNGEKLHVSGQEDLSRALLLTEVGSSRDADIIKTVLDNIEHLISSPAHGFRSLGSAALNMCEVARGCADAYYEFGIHCWDYAASDIIVREAGGVVIDTEGGVLDLMSRRVLAASSKQLADQISPKIQHLVLERD